MILKDLFSVDDEMLPFVCVSGKGAACDGQFQPKFHLHGGIDYGIESEDFLFSVRVLWVSSYADARL